MDRPLTEQLVGVVLLLLLSGLRALGRAGWPLPLATGPPAATRLVLVVVVVWLVWLDCAEQVCQGVARQQHGPALRLLLWPPPLLLLGPGWQ